MMKGMIVLAFVMNLIIRELDRVYINIIAQGILYIISRVLVAVVLLLVVVVYFNRKIR